MRWNTHIGVSSSFVYILVTKIVVNADKICNKFGVGRGSGDCDYWYPAVIAIPGLNSQSRYSGFRNA